MNNERKHEEILDQFVDAINAGELPTIHEHLDTTSEELPELLSLLDFVTWFKVSSEADADDQRDLIKQAVIRQVESQRTWSMQRLITEGETDTLAKATQLGLTEQQISNLSADTTPIDIGEPNEAIRNLSGKYGVRFFNLLGWVRQLISDVISTEEYKGMAPVYTREEKRQSDDKNHASSGE